MLKFIMRALGAAAALLGAAVAQNNQLLSSSEVYTSISATEFVAMMSEGGLAAKQVESVESTITFELSIPSSPESGVLYTTLRNCDQSLSPARCTIVQPFGLFSAVGVTLRQINQFNLEKSNISLVALIENDAGLIGAKSYFNGGITKAHFLTEMGLFLRDVDLVASSITPGVAATINYQMTSNDAFKQSAAKIGIVLPKGVEFKVNSVGANAPRFMPEALRAYLPQ